MCLVIFSAYDTNSIRMQPLLVSAGPEESCDCSSCQTGQDVEKWQNQSSDMAAT